MKAVIVSIYRDVFPVVGFSLMLAGLAVSAQAAPTLAPEIDPGSIGVALTLLTSGALLVSGKGRKA